MNGQSVCSGEGCRWAAVGQASVLFVQCPPPHLLPPELRNYGWVCNHSGLGAPYRQDLSEPLFVPSAQRRTWQNQRGLVHVGRMNERDSGWWEHCGLGGVWGFSGRVHITLEGSHCASRPHFWPCLLVCISLLSQSGVGRRGPVLCFGDPSLWVGTPWVGRTGILTRALRKSSALGQSSRGFLEEVAFAGSAG